MAIRPSLAKVMMTVMLMAATVASGGAAIADPADVAGTSAAESTVEISFDRAPTRSEISEVTKLLGENSVVKGAGSNATVSSSSSFDPVGYDKLACNTFNSWIDRNGEYTLQHACGGSTAPWGYRLSSNIRSIIVGDVSETGMAWWHNGTKKPTQAPHVVGAGYGFHGTYNPVKKGYYIRYQDEFYFRHDVGGGGNGHVTIKGKWYFYNG